MKFLQKLIPLWVLATLAMVVHAATDNQLFSLAEAKYPHYFRGAVRTGHYLEYSYRYYPDTGNYLGIDPLGNLYVLGKDFGQQIRFFASEQNFADSIAATHAQQSPLNSRALITMSGTVTDKDGNPVPGVTIKAFHHNDHITLSTTTDDSGAYVIGGMDSTNNSRYTSEYVVYAEKAGVALAPATDAGATTRFDFNGFYRTVVRFFPMPLKSVSDVNFIASGSGDKFTTLPRTGQQTVYAAGDDAAAAAGAFWPDARFTDNMDGTVTDQLTGLIWLQDAGCLGSTVWSTALIAANQLADGACGLRDGSLAGQWRMPNVNELESLVDIGRSMPALPANHPFAGVAAAYWSSTTYSAAPSYAMVIRFTDGRWINGTDGADNNIKTESVNAAWAVKSGERGKISVLATGVYAGIGGRSFGRGDDASLQHGLRWSTQRFADNGDGTLSDTVTGLTWLKKADCVKADWAGAMDAIDKLASGECGLSDGSRAGEWRLPNRAEMLSISDRAPTFPQANYFSGIPGPDGRTVTSPVIFNNFISYAYYWTSSTTAGDPAQAWTIYSCDFGAYNMLKSDSQHYALAVRDGN